MCHVMNDLNFFPTITADRECKFESLRSHPLWNYIILNDFLVISNLVHSELSTQWKPELNVSESNSFTVWYFEL